MNTKERLDKYIKCCHFFDEINTDTDIDILGGYAIISYKNNYRIWVSVLEEFGDSIIISKNGNVIWRKTIENFNEDMQKIKEIID